jgi:hypothetical protein
MLSFRWMVGGIYRSEKKSLDPGFSIVNSKPADGCPLFYASDTLRLFNYLCY